MTDALIIHPFDNVEVRADGHKYARRAIAAGENIIKYGMPIGHATRAIAKGEHVHVDNVKTNLGEVLEYRYEPSFTDVTRVPPPTVLSMWICARSPNIADRTVLT